MSEKSGQIQFRKFKIQSIIFSNRYNTGTEIVFQDVAVPALSSFILLGIDVISKLSWKNHIRTVCNSFKKDGFAVQDQKLF